jgi:hypothetical protein
MKKGEMRFFWVVFSLGVLFWVAFGWLAMWAASKFGA